jgi:S1-C subfamily serine protease
VVEYVRADGAASQAGIEQRDRLLSVNGELLDSIGRLRELLHGNRARRLEIKGFRQGEERLWSLLPTDFAEPRHNSDFKRWRGLELEISEQPGIYIVSVKPGSVSERAGASVDDRIMGLNGEENADASALWALLSGLGAEPQLLGIRRGDQELWLPTAPE